MTIKTIRNIDEGTWSQLKALAAEQRVSLGIALRMLIENYQKKSESSWDRIFNRKRTLSEKEAKELEQSAKKMRKEKGWRI